MAATDLQTRVAAFLHRPVPEEIPGIADSVAEALLALYVADEKADAEIEEMLELCARESDVAIERYRCKEARDYFRQCRDLLRAIQKELPFRSLMRGPSYHACLEPAVVIAASFSPGFCEDLTGWDLAISQDDELRQAIHLSTRENGYADEWRFERAQIAPEEVRRLIGHAETLAFCGFDEAYAFPATDLETRCLSIHCGDRLKTVQVYGPGEPQGFDDFWREIHGYAPYAY